MTRRRDEAVPHQFAVFRQTPTGIVIEEPQVAMLVKGGYLHSMKLLMEKAAETPEPIPVVSRPRKAPGVLVRSLRRLSALLLGWNPD